MVMPFLLEVDALLQLSFTVGMQLPRCSQVLWLLMHFSCTAVVLLLCVVSL